MSTIIMSRVWPLELPAVAKFVLVSLADQANDQGVCWPSIATLASRTSYSVRAVQNALRWLQDRGLLEVEIGAMRANRYTLHIERYSRATCAKQAVALGVQEDGSAASTPAPHAPLQELHPRTTCTPPPQEVHPNHNRTISNTPPVSPKGEGLASGGEGVQTSRQRRGKEVMSIDEFIDQCRAEGVKPIGPDDPIWAWCDKVGLPDDVLALHWFEFKRRHQRSGKRQADWRLKLRRSVEENWYKLWYFDSQGACRLTSVGVQTQRARGGDAQT